MDGSESWTSICNLKREDQFIVEHSRVPLFKSDSNPKEQLESTPKNHSQSDFIQKIFFKNDRNFSMHDRFTLIRKDLYLDVMKSYSYKYADLKLNSHMAKRRHVVPPSKKTKTKVDFGWNCASDDVPMDLEIKTEDGEKECKVEQFCSDVEFKAPIPFNKRIMFDRSVYRWNKNYQLTKEVLDDDIDRYMAETKIYRSDNDKGVEEMEEFHDEAENLMEFID